MKKLIAIILMLFVVVPGIAKEGGNGQLLVKVNNQWVPVEVALSNDTRVYRGMNMLPGVSSIPEANPTFNKKYGKYMVDWLNVVKSYAPDMAAVLKRAAVTTDFIFVNGEIVFLARDYPQFPVEYKEFKKAALYYEGKIYISIPNMELMKHFDGISKEDQQGLVMVHEVINSEYSRSLSTMERLRLGQLILEIKTRNYSQAQYLAENIFEGFDVLGPLLSTEAKIDLINYLDQMGRLGITNLSLSDIEIMNTYEDIKAMKKGEKLPVNNSDDLIEWAKIFSRKDILGFPGIASAHLTVERIKELIEEGVLTDLEGTIHASPEPIKSRLRKAVQSVWDGYITEPTFEQLKQVPLSWLKEAPRNELSYKISKMIEYSALLEGEASQWNISDIYDFLFSISEDYKARRTHKDFAVQMMGDLHSKIDRACLANVGRSCLVDNQHDVEVFVMNNYYRYYYNRHSGYMAIQNGGDYSLLTLEDIYYNGNLVVAAGQVLQVSIRKNEIKVKVEVTYVRRGKTKTKTETVPTHYVFKHNKLDRILEYPRFPDMRGRNIMLVR